MCPPPVFGRQRVLMGRAEEEARWCRNKRAQRGDICKRFWGERASASSLPHEAWVSRPWKEVSSLPYEACVFRSRLPKVTTSLPGFLATGWLSKKWPGPPTVNGLSKGAMNVGTLDNTRVPTPYPIRYSLHSQMFYICFFTLTLITHLI
jgi:hypothetical protein